MWTYVIERGEARGELPSIERQVLDLNDSKIPVDTVASSIESIY
jgi:hypothetical protein